MSAMGWKQTIVAECPPTVRLADGHACHLAGGGISAYRPGARLLRPVQALAEWVMANGGWTQRGTFMRTGGRKGASSRGTRHGKFVPTLAVLAADP